ncbi:MAG: hypothetical protein R3E02_03585 [Blastomonas sp.]
MVQLFWILTLLACGYAAVFGGRDGRWGSMLLLVAVILTVPANRVDRTWSDTQFAVAAVDTAYLVGIFIVALNSRRYWPIWAAAFQVLTVLTHLATMLGPSVTPKIYYAMSTFWIVPLIFSMVIGVTLDRNAQQSGMFEKPA